MNSSTEQRACATARMLHVFLAAALLLAAAIAMGNQGLNSDLFLAIAAGQETLRGNPGGNDTWSFTGNGRRWIDQAWASHLLLSAAYQFLGPVGPVIWKLVLLAACIGIVLFRCRRLGAAWSVSLWAAYLGLMAALPFLTIRAENFGVLCFLVLGLLLWEADRCRFVRLLAIPLLITLWANLHGSFMLGVGILGLRVSLAWMSWLRGARTGICDRTGLGGPLEWSIAFFGTLLLASVITPFGLDNVLMPFVQVGAGIVTANSSDWLPLLSSGHMDRMIGPGSVFPYLFSLAITVMSVISPIILSLRRRTPGLRTSDLLFNHRYVPWVVEAAILVASGLLAFRFRRLVLFAGFAMVPLTAALMQEVVKRAQLFREGDGLRSLRWPVVPAVFLCLVTGWACYRVAVLPYAPDNPIRPQRSLARDLMSYDTFSPGLVRFLRDNRVRGNAVAGWEISTYILCYSTGIRVFMDTRDQSFYARDVIRDYFSIMGVRDEPADRRLALLDRYGVSLVILTNEPYDFALGMLLLKSGKWGCIYDDDYSLVLARSGSAEFGTMLRQADLAGLKFPDPETRTRTEAMQSRFSMGYVRADLIEKLREMVRIRPWPDYYVLICGGKEHAAGCLSSGTTDFLLSEASRLSRISPMYRHGASEITDSLVKIYDILALDSGKCGTLKARARFLAQRTAYEKLYQEISGHYLGR